MADIIIGERWNTSESLDMALGVRRAIDSVLSQRKPPAECEYQLQKGIEFLNEAKGGFALVTGDLKEADSFNGTFSPLCLANDVYIRFRGGSVDKSEDTKRLSGLFEAYRSALQKVLDKADKSGIKQSELKEIEQFFEVLTDLLLQQADAMTKDYSRPYPPLSLSEAPLW